MVDDSCREPGYSVQFKNILNAQPHAFGDALLPSTNGNRNFTPQNASY